MSDLSLRMELQQVEQQLREQKAHQQRLIEQQRHQQQQQQQQQQQERMVQQQQLQLQLQQTPSPPAQTQQPRPSQPRVSAGPGGTTGSNEIRVLADSSIRRLVADQAITDLAGVVKELVDNALDAQSKSINIRLYGTGLDIVEVSDEGTGVPAASRPFLAQRHTTSKISTVDDIYHGTGMTMGFRGEALFSLAHCSQNLVVATRTASEPTAQKLEFRRDGSLDYASITTIARKIGTTVAVVRPFDAQPARRADLERRIKNERAKMYRLLESYAILCVGVRINVFEMGGQRSDPLIATSPKSKSLSETISSVIGHKFLSSLSPIQIDLKDIIYPSRSECAEKTPAQYRRVSSLSDDANQYGPVIWKASGLISSLSGAAMQASRMVNYYSINGRPVDLPNITAVLRKAWQSFGGKKKPSCVLQLTLPNDRFDINVSPDKREVLLTDDQEICNAINEAVTTLWSNQTNGKFAAQKLEQQLSTPIASTAQDLYGDGGVGSPTEGRRRHKRRFAFVNDLSNAKMQHDESTDSPAAPQTIGQAASQTTETSASAQNDSDVPVPVANNVKIVSTGELQRCDREDDHAELATPEMCRKRMRVEELNESSADSAICKTPLARRRLDCEMEEEEEKKENNQNVQCRVSATSSGPAARTFPVTPDESQFQLKLRPNQAGTSALASVPELDDDDPNRPNTTKDPSPRVTTQTSLDRFSFKPVNKSAAVRKIDTIQRQEREKRLQNRKTAKTLASKNNRVDEQQKSPTMSERKFDDDSPVVWSGFSSTEAIIHSARSERLDDLRRKSNIKAARRRPSDLSSDESDTADVAPSVGAAAGDRVISLTKKIFHKDMQIIGQFNHGFIVARSSDNHIWILDQHACDEKQKFEQLCRDTVIHEQKLFSPMRLELSAAEEACILDNEDVFAANGFRFKFDPDAPIRHRVSLTALPYSGARDGRKAVQFDKEDVSALCAMLSEGAAYDAGGGGTGTNGSGKYGNNAVRRHASQSASKNPADRLLSRLPKAIAMFASRACRSSVMIGTAMSHKEMETLVQRMAEVDQPWTCAHGRPTMRHVGDVQSTILDDERRSNNHISDSTYTIPPMTQDVPEKDTSEDEDR